MKNKSLNLLSLILCLVILPSCIHYYEMSKKEFPQGKEKKEDYEELVQQNLKSTRVYDQFETKASFDCLWMSDEMKIAFQNMHSEIKGKNNRTKKALIRRDLEDSKHWITFYVLSDVRGKTNTSLTDTNSLWSLYLKFGKKKVAPISIKEVELQPEIKRFFGSKISNFKIAYLVKFPASDLNRDSYLKKSDKMNLFFSSSSKYTKVSWSKQEAKNALEQMKREGAQNEKDYYWI